MDVQTHWDVMRLYQDPGLKQIGTAINKRNEVVQWHKTEHTV